MFNYIIILLIISLRAQIIVEADKVHFPRVTIKNKIINYSYLPSGYSFYLLAPLPNSLNINDINTQEEQIDYLLVQYPGASNKLQCSCNATLYQNKYIRLNCKTKESGDYFQIFQLANITLNFTTFSYVINPEKTFAYMSSFLCGPGKCFNKNINNIPSKIVNVENKEKGVSIEIDCFKSSSIITTSIGYVGTEDFNLIGHCTFKKDEYNIMKIYLNFNIDDYDFEYGVTHNIFFIDHCEEKYIVYRICFQDKNSIRNCCPSSAPYLNGETCSSSCQLPNIYTYNNVCLKECASPLKYTSNGNFCVEKCDDNQFYYKEKNICLSTCKIYNLFDDVETKACTVRCKSNKYIEDNKCVDKCSKNYYLYDKECYSNCSTISMYNDVINRKCIDICHKYVEENNCVDKCSYNYFFYNNECYKNCSIKFLFNDLENHSCSSFIPLNKFIDDFSIVDSCSKDKFIKDSECVEKCEDDEFIFNNQCVNDCKITEYKYSFNNICVYDCPFGIKEGNECITKLKNKNTNYNNILKILIWILSGFSVIFIMLIIILLCRN